MPVIGAAAAVQHPERAPLAAMVKLSGLTVGLTPAQ